jgi:acetoin utilization deacetylase AcuC-like enzyme
MTTHLFTIHSLKRIIIIDLDAHQGNGYQIDLLGSLQASTSTVNTNMIKGDVYILDAYNHSIYPSDN